MFLVNLPVGGLALVVISLTMPRRRRARRALDRLARRRRCSRPARRALLLGLVWGGRQYAWTSGHVVGALVAAVVLLVPSRSSSDARREPILPFDVLRNPIVAGSVACMALVGMAMFGTISYVPLFVQGVIGTSATSSGVVLTPLMLGAVDTSILTGQLVSRTGRYRWNAVLGPVVLTVGMLLLWRMDVRPTNGEAARNMVIAGIGIGSMMQVFVLSVQNAVPRSRIGSATALDAVRAADGGDARRHDHGRDREPRAAARASAAARGRRSTACRRRCAGGSRPRSGRRSSPRRASRASSGSSRSSS